MRCDTVQIIIVIVAIGILVTIAYGDVRTRRIPNVLAGAIAVLGLIRLMLTTNSDEIGHTLAASLAVLTAGFLLFWGNVVGGGDAKLMGAMTLLIGFHDLFDFFLLMGIAGGALGLGILVHNRFRPNGQRLLQQAIEPLAMESTGDNLPPVQPTVPYGVAIAAAGVVMLFLKSLL